MCDICGHNICPSMCPNAEQPKVICECSECGFEIYEGDDYYEIEGKIYCETCIDGFKKEAVYE